ncbi:MAG TPA: hypothetical protein VHM16_01805, partial [Rubrobacteraceae bacterium]|nr:hypothetical protein [Rubrobacteraceae bacterium]
MEWLGIRGGSAEEGPSGSGGYGHEARGGKPQPRGTTAGRRGSGRAEDRGGVTGGGSILVPRRGNWSFEAVPASGERLYERRGATLGGESTTDDSDVLGEVGLL